MEWNTPFQWLMNISMHGYPNARVYPVGNVIDWIGLSRRGSIQCIQSDNDGCTLVWAIRKRCPSSFSFRIDRVLVRLFVRLPGSFEHYNNDTVLSSARSLCAMMIEGYLPTSLLCLPISILLYINHTLQWHWSGANALQNHKLYSCLPALAFIDDPGWWILGHSPMEKKGKWCWIFPFMFWFRGCVERACTELIQLCWSITE